ncbi:MAG: DoxX family protein [Streptosporangiales bacterium]|nr:DoxX family protein [Streptosporangiales bacterium]
MDDSAVAQGSGRRSAANIVIWVLQVLLAAYLLIFSALPMATGQEYIVETFDRVGYGQWFRYFTAVVESAGAIGLLVPRLAGLAALGLVGVMIGAVTTELAVRSPSGAVLPAVLGVLFCVVAWYRRGDVKAFVTIFRR